MLQLILKCVLTGDFAILVKSGLTIKQAIAYNMASAVISYIGLISGILIGNLDSAHGWVLALTAGMFLYVSLVDMVGAKLSRLIKCLVLLFLLPLRLTLHQTQLN